MPRSTPFALALVLASVTPAPAQQVQQEATVVRSVRATGQLGVGVQPEFHYKRKLLKFPAILEELQVTDAQQEALKQADEEFTLAAKRLTRQIQQTREQLKQQGDPAAEQAFRLETLNYGKKLTQPTEKPFLKVLDRNQAKRLEQIQIRADGYMAFMRPDVLDRLGLTPDQETAIAALVAEARTQVFAAATIAVTPAHDFTTLPEEARQARFASPDYQAALAQVRTKVTDARTTALRAIREVLTKAQQATFKNMVGEPFDFRKLTAVATPERPALPGSPARAD